MGDIHSHRYKKLLKLLREERKARRLTQQAVAERLGKLQGWVSKYENGEREISLLDYLDIASAVGFEPLKLLGRITSKSPRVDKLFR